MRIPNHKTTSSSTEQYGFNPAAPRARSRRLSFFWFFWIFPDWAKGVRDGLRRERRRTRAEDENFACVTRCAREGSREYAGEPILLGAYRHSCLRLARNVRARSAV